MDGLFNGYYPNGINLQQNQAPKQTTQGGVVYVGGLSGAKAFRVPINSKTILLDDDGKHLYIKTADTFGMADIQAFEMSEIKAEELTEPKEDLTSQFVTRKEFEKLTDEIKKLSMGGKRNASKSNATSSAATK